MELDGTRKGRWSHAAVSGFKAFACHNRSEFNIRLLIFQKFLQHIPVQLCMLQAFLIISPLHNEMLRAIVSRMPDAEPEELKYYTKMCAIVVERKELEQYMVDTMKEVCGWHELFIPPLKLPCATDSKKIQNAFIPQIERDSFQKPSLLHPQTLGRLHHTAALDIRHALSHIRL